MKPKSILGHTVYYPRILFYYLPASLLNPSECVSDLKEICAQSCCHKEVFGDTKSLKKNSQQPYFWSRMTWNTLYFPLIFLFIFWIVCNAVMSCVLPQIQIMSCQLVCQTLDRPENDHFVHSSCIPTFSERTCELYSVF